jgi:hypothetical protein
VIIVFEREKRGSREKLTLEANTQPNRNLTRV